MNELIRVKVSSSQLSDECLIAFNPQATNNYDTGMDAQKMVGSSNEPQLSTISSNIPLTVNFLNDSISADSIPISIQIPFNGIYCFDINSSTNKKYYFFDSNNKTSLFLTDSLTYTTTLSMNDNPHRFSLILKKTIDSSIIKNPDTVTVQKIPPSSLPSKINNIECFAFNHWVNIIGMDPSANTLCEVYDLNGRLIETQHCSFCSEMKINISSDGVYIIKIVNKEQSKIQKIIIFN